jgi:uncharacterized membrane protein YeaQ/YmgE (transglycosylase-associated protein family)
MTRFPVLWRLSDGYVSGGDSHELQFAAVIGAVVGGVTGYLLSHMVESGGWLKILIWALIGAAVAAGVVFCLRAFRS